MTQLPELKTLVASLPEVYQPLFGHPELSSQASRASDVRLKQILDVHDALARHLKRPVRVLDLGCAQGWFGFNLAQAGAEVLGIDYLVDNINVCNMLVLENRHLHIRFNHLDIQHIPQLLGDNQFDLVLGLSVFHHLCNHHGKEATRDLINQILSKVPTGLFEMALATESPSWASAQPQQTNYLLESQPFYHILGHYETHLSSIRPFYFCSRLFWYLGGELGEFQSYVKKDNGRNYYFGHTVMAKLYRMTGERHDSNHYAIERSADFLRSPPSGYLWAPQLLQVGKAEGDAWLVQEKVQGVMLSESIRQEQPYDEKAVLMGVLKQLAVLEKHGLYHADLRVWNILMTPHGFPLLIDYNEISSSKHDCVWPDSPFLAFFLFVNEVVTRQQFDVEPSRAPYISPYNLPAPYRAWIEKTWALPVHEWSFAFLLSSLEGILSPQVTQEGEDDTSTALWMKSIEQNLDRLNGTVNSMSRVVKQLHTIVVGGLSKKEG